MTKTINYQDAIYWCVTEGRKIHTCAVVSVAVTVLSSRLNVPKLINGGHHHHYCLCGQFDHCHSNEPSACRGYLTLSLSRTCTSLIRCL